MTAKIPDKGVIQTSDIPRLPLGNVNQKQHAHQYSSKDDIYFQSHMYNNKFCIMTEELTNGHAQNCLKQHVCKITLYATEESCKKMHTYNLYNNNNKNTDFFFLYQD